MRSFPLICALAVIGTFAFADAPQVPSDAPYIVLAKNLDEPNGYGFCLDTAGRGQTDLMQAHSCKPAAKDDAGNPVPNDTQFTYDAGSMRVEAVAFPGQCMQVLISPYTAVFGLLDCDDHPSQKFVLSPDDGTLRMNEDQTMCVSLGSETLEAGPWSRRDIALTPCDETEDELKQWTFVVEP
ncbi:MAG: hypothetical protein AAGI09_11055 [Pseudomonadota bacterium]